MAEMLAHTKGLVERQALMATQLREQAIGDQIAQANEFRETRETLHRVGQSVSESVSASLDTSMRSLVAAVTAHMVAPDPQVTGLQQAFERASTRVGELERQLAEALAHITRGGEEHQREAARLHEELQSAHQRQVMSAS